jgi:hypothetical protein
VRNRQRVGHKSILTYVVFVCSVSPTTCHRREIGHNRQTKCAMQLQYTLEVVASTCIAYVHHCNVYAFTAGIMKCTLQTYYMILLVWKSSTHQWFCVVPSHLCSCPHCTRCWQRQAHSGDCCHGTEHVHDHRDVWTFGQKVVTFSVKSLKV